jgi:DNA-directed RNA polymerase subunit RPC12/RpoP
MAGLGSWGDGGSMNGSGINSGDYSGWFYCSPCDEEFELDGSTDDSHIYAYAECPKCKGEVSKELPSKEELERDYWADYKEGK